MLQRRPAPRRALIAALAPVTVLALLAGTCAVPASAAERPTLVVGTGQNLPSLGSSGIYDAGPGFATQIRAYHASGQWARDRARVNARAATYLRTWMRTECADRRACRPAVVLDIDDTLVSWFGLLSSIDFGYSPAIANAAIVGCQAPLIRSTAALMATARSLGADVFLMTGRKEADRAATLACLGSLGITGERELIMRTPAEDGMTATEYKSAARRDIERRGWRIALALGDQVSDSAGGATDAAFVLPNPMYFIP